MCDESPRDTFRESGRNAALEHRDALASLISALRAHVDWAQAARTYAASAARDDITDGSTNDITDALDEAGQADARVELYERLVRELKAAD